MKQILLKTWLIVVCLLVGAGTGWAEEHEYDFSTNNLYTSSNLVTKVSTGSSNTLSTFYYSNGDAFIGHASKVYLNSGYLMAQKNGNTGDCRVLTLPTYNNQKITTIKITSSASGGAPNVAIINYSNSTLSTVVSAQGWTASTQKTYTYNIPTAHQSKELSIMITGANAQITVITISTTADAPTPPYTVTFNAGSNGSCLTTSLTESSVGAGVTLPSCTANTNYTFVGWSTSSTPTSANAGKVGDTYKPSSNCTLYAYYTYQAPSHDAKFFVNGEQYGETQSVAEGSAIAFPTNKPADIDDKKFVGWTEVTISATTNTAPTFVTSATMGTNDKYFYAVFATANGGGNDEWVEITSAPDAGTYAICSDSYFMKAEVSSNRFTNGSATPSITDGKLTTAPADDCTWEITKPDTYYRIQNGSNYAGGTNSKNQGALLTDASADLAKWSISYVTDHFEVINYGRSQASSDSGNKYLRNNTTSGWATYASGTGSAPRLFKKVGGTTYTDYCTSVSSKPAPTLSFANPTYNATMGDAFVAPTLTNPQGVTVSYTSSETGVATVNATTGEVSLVGAGITTITASYDGSESDTYNSNSASYQLVVAAAPAQKYEVTIETPENGTLTIKDGENVINNGDEVEEGTILTIEVEAADGYHFKNWGYKDGDAAWVGNNTTTFTHTMPSAPCSFKATFELIPTYTIAFSVNGAIVQTDDLKEGAAVTVPAAPADINDKVFTGWIETATVEGETPAYVTPATTAKKTVTYYAVFATQTGSAGGTGTIELTNDDISNIYDSKSTSYKEGTIGDWSFKGAINKTSETYYVQMNRETNNTKSAYNSHLSTPVCPAPIKSIAITTTNATASGRTFILTNSAEVGAATTDGESVYGYGSLTEVAGSVTIDVTGNPTSLHIYPHGGAVYVSSVVITYGSDPTYSDYTTTPAPASEGGTINFVATDGNKYYATFSNNRGIKFDEAFVNEDETCLASVKAYAVAVIGGQIIKTSLTDDYNDGNYTYIPANTGVLFEYILEDGYVFDGAVPFEYADTEVEYLDPVEDNMLVACSATGACPSVDGTNYYYKLAYGDNTNKTKLGFWWGADDGSGNFNVKAGGAVLVVPQSSASNLRGFSFEGEGITTDIESIGNAEVAGEIFNLQGQRMNRIQKGVNIINGKKVIR